MTLPPCSDDDYGILPPSTTPYPATLTEIKQRFVDEAPKSQRSRRHDIHTILTVHVAAVRRLFTQPVIWLNGGFVTHKTWKVPRDADLVVIVDPEDFPKADTDPALPLWTLAGSVRLTVDPTLMSVSYRSG